MAMEVFMLNPPKRRRKSRTLKKNALRRFFGGKLKLSGYRKGKRRLTKRLSLSPGIRSKFRRSLVKRFGRNAEGMDIMAAPGAYAFDITAPAAPKRRKFKLPAGVRRTAGGGFTISGTRKRSRKAARRTARKGTKTMARRRGRRVRRIGKRASKRKIAAIIRTARRHSSPRLWLKRRGIGKRRLKKYMGTRRRRSSFAKRHPIGFILGHKRLAANRRRSRRRYARNRGLTTWQKLVKAHGVKGAKRVYRGNRKSRRRSRRRSYRKNRELYQIGPVAANRPRRYRRNRELYQVSSGFSANPATAALAFPKAVFSVPFIMKNVVPIGIGAVGSDLLAGLMTKYVLKDPKWSNAPWKKALLTAGAGALGGLGIGMATKGRKADWAYKFAAGGMLVAFISMFNAYLKKSLGLSGMGIGEYSGIGYGSDDLKRRIAEELKTELDGVGGFITQEDMDRGISSSNGSVSGFVTSEDLPSEGSSISMDDFAATATL